MSHIVSLLLLDALPIESDCSISLWTFIAHITERPNHKPFFSSRFLALFCCLFSSFLEGMSAIHLIQRRQMLQGTEAEDKDGVTAPLLPSQDQVEEGEHKNNKVWRY
jgi:hypothetical protein